MAFTGGLLIGLGFGLTVGWLWAHYTKDMENRRKDEDTGWEHVSIGGPR